MTTTAAERIRIAFERNVTAMKRRPSIGHGTAVTRVRMGDGLACEVEEGPWRLTVDMSEKSGGAGAGPNPGVLGRGALGACLAIGYVMWAARLGVPLASVEIEVQADYNSRTHYGVDTGPASYAEVRCLVSIVSDAPEAEILRVLDTADAHSSYLDVFRRPVSVLRAVRIETPAR